MTTNANLLDRELSATLLDEGLNGITFSVSDFGEDYELVYNLNWEKTRKNILDFLELRDELDRPFELVLSIVEHDLNTGKIEEMEAYWREQGINGVLHFPQNNRGGACDNAHFFLGNDKYDSQAREILAKKGASTLCSSPFFFVFIGWNGQYYICCSDYKKESPLGSVFEYGIEEMDQIKLDSLVANNLPACVNCNVDPVNAVREKLFDLEAGVATLEEVEAVADHYTVVNNRRLPRA